jgi:hypothetical protein
MYQASIFMSETLRLYRPTRFSLGGNREGEIPDPIPNSEVKPFFADGTVHKSMGE